MEQLTPWHAQVAASIAQAHPLESAQQQLRFLVQIKRGKYVQEQFEAEGPDSLTVAHSFDAIRGPGQYVRVTALPRDAALAADVARDMDKGERLARANDLRALELQVQALRCSGAL